MIRMLRPFALAVVLAIAGAGLNGVPEPFYNGGMAIFGLAASVAAALLLPLPFALPTIIISAIPLWLTFNDYPGLVLLSALPIIIHHFCFKGPLLKPLKVGLLLWSIVAVPVLLVGYSISHQDSAIYALTATLVTWMSGVFAVIVGHLLSMVVQFSLNKTTIHAVRANRLLGYLFTSVFFLSVLTVIYIYIAAFQKQQLGQIDRYMTQRLSVLNEQIGDFIQTHSRAITQSAGLMSYPFTEGGDDIKRADLILSLLADAYPQFLTFLTAGADGDITHAFPLTLLDRARETGFVNVSERGYFSEVMRTNQPFVSPVFQGRGFGSEPIIALSAPLLDASGNATGIIEGSLSLGSFSHFDQQNLPGFALLIADEENRVIYASKSLGLEELQTAPEDRIATRHVDSMYDKKWISQSNVMNQREWAVHIYYDFDHFIAQSSNYLLIALVMLVVLAALGIYIGKWVGAFFARPMQELVNHFSEFDPAHPSPKSLVTMGHTQIEEVVELDNAFVSLQKRLIQVFSDLGRARESQRTLNIELEQLNTSLESRIAEKTQSLAYALRQAETANIAKTQFLANMSHEIRTPMNGILGTCENLLETNLNASTRDRVNVIAQSANNLLLILNSILDWSKIEAGKMTVDNQPVLLNQILESCAGLYAQAVSRKGIALNTQFDASLNITVMADAGKISQIVNNLLSNAIKFTEKGSITLRGKFAHSQLTVSVSDTGIGISAEKLDKVFEQFEQADTSTTRLYGGTGLGLTITRKLIELQRGQVTVDSEPGIGTTFTFTLPLAATSQVLEESEQQFVELPPGIRVLLVEDNEINAEIVVDMLRAKKVRCVRTVNGQQALEAVERYYFDIILMDCQMPVMDGFEATRLIRARKDEKAAIPIIALTANAFAEDRAACLAAGMNAHLAKPIRKIALFTMLSQFLMDKQSDSLIKRYQ